MKPNCRLCSAPLARVVVDLGMSPLSNGFLHTDQALTPEVFYPLRVFVCDECRLVQLPALERRENIFSAQYAYFSSYSTSWLQHCERYAARMIQRLSLKGDKLVLEIASNDGYLLQYFARAGIPVLGIEPSANVAEVAVRERNVRTEVAFFGVDLAKRLGATGVSAALICANNVLAHVPDLRDFLGGIPLLLAPDGVVTFEFPHLLQLLQQGQFDTIYQEHFSYLSLHTVQRALAEHGLRIFDVEALETHGGSLRVYACRTKHSQPTLPSVGAMTLLEHEGKLDDVTTYAALSDRAKKIKCDLLRFLVGAKTAGKKVVGYGAPAKGNTLLNYCGVRDDFIDFIVDLSPHKQGTMLPGTHILVRPPGALDEARPDYVLILPWNLRNEIIHQLGHIKAWNGQFVVAVPQLEVFGA